MARERELTIKSGPYDPETRRDDHRPRRKISRPKVVFVGGEDWNGMYINGKLVVEGHSIAGSAAAVALGAAVSHREVDQQWLESHGLPDRLEDLPSDVADVRGPEDEG